MPFQRAAQHILTLCPQLATTFLTTQESPISDSTPKLLAHLAGTWHGALPIRPSPLNHSDSPSGTNSCCTDGETEAPRGIASWSCGPPALLGYPFLLAGALQVARWLGEF